MPMKNIIEKSEGVKVNERYDLTYNDLYEIYRACEGDPFDLIAVSFKIGYLQGSKAERRSKNG